MSLLPSWIILPDSFRAFMARVMLTRCAPVKKLRSSCVKGNWITAPFELMAPCSSATLLSTLNSRSSIFVTAKLLTRLVNQETLSLRFFITCKPTLGCFKNKFFKLFSTEPTCQCVFKAIGTYRIFTFIRKHVFADKISSLANIKSQFSAVFMNFGEFNATTFNQKHLISRIALQKKGIPFFRFLPYCFMA
jgi:hypothetical protein